MESLKPESSHPKLNPILVQRFASGKNQNEKNIQKYSIYSSKEFKIQHFSQLNKTFSKTLASQYILSKLAYDFKPRFFPKDTGLPASVTCFFSQIKNLPCLATFHLKVSQSSRFHTQNCLKPLMMSLASLKNLSDLVISFVNRPADPKLLKLLFKYLQKIKTLTHLSITFWALENSSISHLDVLSSGLRKLFQLHSLVLSFGESFELHEHAINKLALILPKLSFLTKIGLRFNEDSISSDAILNLFSYLKNMKNLSDITLAIQHKSREISKEPISQGLALLDHSRIQKLKLQSYQHFDNNSLIQFSEALKKFTSLRTLQFKLYVSHHRTPEEGLAALVSTLSSLVSLSSLTIFLNSVNWKKFIEGISVPFKYLKNLVNLNLQIYGYTYPLHNEEIQKLFANLSFLKESLRYFSLSYPQETLNDKNIETLAESLKELTLLQNLALDLSYAKMITNNGVEALACSIKTLKNLSGLKIWLKKNEKIDDKAIDQIVKILQELPCLDSIDFNLLLCPKITCFDELLKALKQAKNIGEVALGLPSSALKSHEITYLMEKKVVKRMTSALN